MLLAVDIGNTNIVFGCVDDNDEVVLFERISTNHNATAAEYAVLIRTILEMNSFNISDIHVVCCSLGDKHRKGSSTQAL